MIKRIKVGKRNGKMVVLSKSITQKSITAKVKKVLGRNSELKFVNYQGGPAAIGNVFNVADVFQPTQGGTDNQRNGDRCTLTSTIITFGSQVNNLGADPYNTIRWILVQWHPNTVPTAANILLNGPSGTQDVWSHYNHDNRQEYKILFDKIQTLSVNGDEVKNRHLFRVRLKKAQKQVQFVAAGTAGTNKLYLLYVTDGAGAHPPNLVYACKTFFRDI